MYFNPGIEESLHRWQQAGRVAADGRFELEALGADQSS